MRKFKFAKLVRDKILEQTASHAIKVESRTLDRREYIEELKKKLKEEAKELLNAKEDELTGELADVQEILDYLLKELNISKKELNKKQTEKIEKSGAFKNKTFIETVTITENDEWLDYYQEKYKELKDKRE